MKCNINIDPAAEGVTVTITAPRKTEEVRAIAALCLLGFAAGSLSLWGESDFSRFQFYFGSLPQGMGVGLSFALWFLFGAEVAVATLPFAEERRALLIQSLAHYAVMMATVAWYVWINLDLRFLRGMMLIFTLLYVLVWTGRWVGWYAEAAQIREKLGLSFAPSVLKWRETLPHMGFACLLCLVLPIVLSMFDAAEVDVPVLSALLYPWFFLPVGGFVSAFSLGRRQGFCPLYPLSCAVLCFVFAKISVLWVHMAYGKLPLWALLIACAGNLAGACVRHFILGRARAFSEVDGI